MRYDYKNDEKWIKLEHIPDMYESTLTEESWVDWDSSGASRGVMISEEAPIVFKVEFDGEEGYDDFWEFEHNYCQRELRIYKEAEAAGYEYLFLPLEYVDTIGVHDVYVQDQCDIHSSIYHYYDEHEKSMADVTEYLKDLLEIAGKTHIMWDTPLTWLNDVRLTFDDDEDFLDFLDWLEERVDDIRADNVGYVEGGAPVLCDYASYLE